MRTRYEVLASLVMAGLAGTAAYPAQAGLITLTVDQTGGADYTTLSAAVAAANADKNLANTYHIQLAPGTYLNDYANIQRPMEIFGAGADSTVLQSTIALPNQKGIIHTIASLWQSRTCATLMVTVAPLISTTSWLQSN